MDSKRMEELQKIAQEKKEKNIRLKKEVEEKQQERKAKENEFKSSFLRFENTILKPYVNEANKILKSAEIVIDYESNTTTKDFKNQIKTYVTIFYRSKGQSIRSQLPYITFEGNPNSGKIFIEKKTQMSNGSTPELVGDHKIEDLNDNKIEEILHSFVTSFK